jgi:hypothetical protein
MGRRALFQLSAKDTQMTNLIRLFLIASLLGALLAQVPSEDVRFAKIEAALEMHAEKLSKIDHTNVEVRLARIEATVDRIDGWGKWLSTAIMGMVLVWGFQTFMRLAQAQQQQQKKERDNKE